MTYNKEDENIIGISEILFGNHKISKVSGNYENDIDQFKKWVDKISDSGNYENDINQFKELVDETLVEEKNKNINLSSKFSLTKKLFIGGSSVIVGGLIFYLIYKKKTNIKSYFSRFFQKKLGNDNNLLFSKLQIDK